MRTLLTTLFALASTPALLSAADNLLRNPSFELPVIEGKKHAREGGSPALLADREKESSWTAFLFPEIKGDSHVVAGMTNTLARTGKQSIFVEYNKFSEVRGKGVALLSEMLPVKPNENYRVSIWGRLDRDRPLTLDERRPELVLEAEFYEADLTTQIGDTEARAQDIPGTKNRILFFASRWSEFYTDIETPENAAAMKITWRWITTRRDGETDGIIYFDDAAVVGPAGAPLVDPPEDAGDDEEMTEDEEKAPAPAAPKPAPASK